VRPDITTGMASRQRGPVRTDVRLGSEMAAFKRGVDGFTRRTRTPHLIHHSDRGVQYVSLRYTQRLVEAGIEPSVGSVGDSYDNALAETINGLFKAEVIHRCGPWRSFEAVEFATLEWVDWFNNRRLLEPIGNVPPAEAEAAYYAQLEVMPMAA
jgi:putative transposase